jgi:hypothetical protein
MTPRRARPPQRSAEHAAPPDGRTVPFDSAFVFKLEGKPGKTHRKPTTVSIESPFVAVSIGYGLIPTLEPVRFGLRRTQEEAAGEEVVEMVAAADLPGGDLTIRSRRLEPATVRFRALPLIRTITPANIRFANIVAGFQTAVRRQAITRRPPVVDLYRTAFRFTPRASELLAIAGDEEIELDDGTAQELFETVHAPLEDVQFKYALFDDGTGREFQSEAVLSTAGLGGSTGERPFRYFAQPIRFEPQSTIRMEVTEVTPFEGELYVVLHGYKVVGGLRSTADRAARERRMTRRRR